MSSEDEQTFEGIDEFTHEDFEELGEGYNPYVDQEEEASDTHNETTNEEEQEREEQDDEIQYGDKSYGEVYTYEEHDDSVSPTTERDDESERTSYRSRTGSSNEVKPRRKKKSKSKSNSSERRERRKSSKLRAAGADEESDPDVRDDPATTIRKLSKQNKNLKQQLVELNAIIDRQLQQKGIKVQSAAGVIASKRMNERTNASEKEVRNLMKQNEHYKKENEDLKKLVYGSEVSDKVVRLENVVRDKQRVIRMLENEKKGLENQVREQSKALEKISDGSESKVQQISSDIRWLKETNRKLRDKTLIQKDALDKQNNQIFRLRKRIDELNKVLEVNKLDANTVDQLKALREEIDETKKQSEAIKKTSEVEQRSLTSKWRRAVTESQAKDIEMKRLQEVVESLKEQLEDKDKEMRQAVLQARQDSRGIRGPRTISRRVNNLEADNEESARGEPNSSLKTRATPAARSPQTVRKETKTKKDVISDKKSESATTERGQQQEDEFEEDFVDVEAQEDVEEISRKPTQKTESTNENISVFKPAF